VVQEYKKWAHSRLSAVKTGPVALSILTVGIKNMHNISGNSRQTFLTILRTDFHYKYYVP
jgi:hypothetical protein